MKNRNRMVSFLAGLMAAVMLLTLVLGLLPTTASAASSGEIRRQINALKEEKELLGEKMVEVQEQYEENEDEIADLIARKNIIDQEIQLLSQQIVNINSQITAYNALIADKQDELDTAEDRYQDLNQENRLRVRTMEEEGELSYWEVIFQASSFADLLDRLNMVEEINASDKRRLRELSDAAQQVETAQTELEGEKEELEAVKQDLDDTQAQQDAKCREAEELLQQLFTTADDLTALHQELEAAEQALMDQIAKMEVQYTAAKQAEWAAYMATYVPPENQQAGYEGSAGGGTAGTSGSSGTWLVPVSYTSVTSPFGNRESPTAGASSNHMGVDLDTGTGDPVVATRPGVVVAATNGGAAGNYVTIDHGDGFRSTYMHLNDYSVSVGQIVGAGQNIGSTGSSGITTGDHLHFGISYNGVYVNPFDYIG